MPEAASIPQNVSMLIGELVGKQEGMGREIGEVKEDIKELREGQQAQATKLDSVGADVKRVLTKMDEIEMRCDRRHPNGTAALERVNTPAGETLGDFFSRISVKALETGVLAISVAAFWFLIKLAAGAL